MQKKGLTVCLLCMTAMPLAFGTWPTNQIFAQTAKAVNKTADSPEKNSLKKQPVKLPGLVVDFENKCVDIEATICLDKGLLELLACSKGSKEHESMLAISARPIHIHTGLLLLGAKNGHPAIRKKLGGDDPRWVDLPPRGDPVRVTLVFHNANKKLKVGKSLSEHELYKFVEFSGQSAEKTKSAARRSDKTNPKTPRFPTTFLFAGSHLEEVSKGPRKYLAEKSGNLISISTFGDELLCLPEIHSQKNNSLMWRIKPGTLPAVGEKILLRLRPLIHAEKRSDAEKRNREIKSKKPTVKPVQPTNKTEPLK